MLRFEKLSIQGFKSFCDPTDVAFDEEGITAVVGPNGCGKCVDGDTLVTLADGRDAAIRELVDSALQKADPVENLDDGFLTRKNPHSVEILTLNPATLRLEPRPVSAFVKRTATPYLLHIRTRSGREVTATPYHPLFTLEKGRIRALKAEELQAGVRIVVPRHLPVEKIATCADGPNPPNGSWGIVKIQPTRAGQLSRIPPTAVGGSLKPSLHDGRVASGRGCGVLAQRSQRSDFNHLPTAVGG